METQINASLSRRLWAISALLLVAFAALGGRLLYLQVLRHEKVNKTVVAIHRQETLREPRRGEIRDVRGRVLATSKFVKTVCADPVLVGGHHEQIARTLAPILAMKEDDLSKLLQQRWRWSEDEKKWMTNKFVIIQRKVLNETWLKAQEALSGMQFATGTNKLTSAQAAAFNQIRTKAVFAYHVDDQLRVYPNKSLGAHVLGYLNPLDNLPVRGAENAFEDHLAGLRGWRTTQTDARKREVVPMRTADVRARDGQNVVLTIDATAQYIVEDELAEAMKTLAPLSASCVVVRPKTGQILAMASAPTFDPNTPARTPAPHHRNLLISAVNEPGSTFKIVVIAAALNEKEVTLRERFDCERGAFHYGGKILHDHEPLGVLSVEEIITKSSNIGAAKIGIRLGPERLYKYIRDFGFGEVSNIMLDREEKGLLRSVTNWHKVTLAQIPMGHGLAVTPLQMTMAMCAIANGGRLMAPVLMDRIEDDQGRVIARSQPQVLRQVVSEEAARQVVQALKTVVATNGTAPKARMELHTVAGKTGTAQKAIGGHYVKGKYFSSFIGFFPADDPELCISVVLDEPTNGYYGGQTAAPVFKKIGVRLANYLSIRPDQVTQETLKTSVPSGRVAAR